MRKILYVVFGLFSCFNQAQPLENELLWKISGKGLEQPSYLFGTIHATCDATLDDTTLKALEDTKQLYLEIDMDDPMLQMQMIQGMAMKDGVTIASLVSEDEFVLLDEFLQQNIGMSAKMINTFKPFMLSSMLLPKLLDCEFQSIEMELMKVTKAQNEEVYGLETVSEQLAIFDKISYEEQVKELLKTAKSDLTKEKKEMKKVMDVYKTKDIEKMLVLMDESDNTISADNIDLLVVNRNKNWIPVIEKVIKNTPTFFGVGAAHLAGDTGVIKLLRKQGYKVESVKKE
jgi:uncharacterized protein YbaP (TraB family)